MKKILTGIGLCSLLFGFTVLAQAPLEPNNPPLDNPPLAEDDLFVDDLGLSNGSMPANNQTAPQETLGYSSVENTYSVVNVSQNNANAESSGAREGDVLRYEFRIKSDTTDVENFVTSLDISEILQYSEVIDAGLGNVNGGTIVFPSFTQKAPCEKVFTFFVRINKCTPQTRITSSGHGQQTTVTLSCELAQSGPSSNMMWYMTLALLTGFAIIGIFNRRTHKL